jgi:hypothetical protein
MGSTWLVRWGAIGLMLGGAVWLVLGLSALLGYLQAIPGREDVVLLIVALLLTAAGLVGLHALQGARYGFLGRAALCIALTALLARAVGAGVYLAGSSALAWISYPWGTVVMLVGFVAYGAATLRARVLPLWYGLALAVSVPLSLPLAAYGTALFGLIMGVLGYALWWRKDASTESKPPRVE